MKLFFTFFNFALHRNYPLFCSRRNNDGSKVKLEFKGTMPTMNRTEAKKLNFVKIGKLIHFLNKEALQNHATDFGTNRLINCWS